MRSEIPIRPIPVPLVAKFVRQVKDDGHRQDVKFPRQGHKRLSRFRLYVCGVDGRKFAGGQPFAGNKMQHFEGVVGRGLSIFVVGNQSPAEVGGEYLRRLKMHLRES